jgi:signal transduction histidine kinase
MQFFTPKDEMIYYCEILNAKLKIRDHYLQTVVKEIYENTGQLLSLVRVKLAIIGSQFHKDAKLQLTDSGKVIGEVIYNLRAMSRNIFPENELLSESGLLNALKQELKDDPQDNIKEKVIVKGIPFALAPGSGLIFSNIVLEITSLIIQSCGEDSLVIEFVYTNTQLRVIMNYSGEPVDFNIQQENKEMVQKTNLSVAERIKLIGGKLMIKNSHSNKIEVSIPYYI